MIIVFTVSKPSNLKASKTRIIGMKGWKTGKLEVFCQLKFEKINLIKIQTEKC